MQDLKSLFNHGTATGLQRVDGLVVFWVSWWIDSGGLYSIDSVAETIDWHSIDWKVFQLSDTQVGKLILSKHSYYEDFFAKSQADFPISHILSILDLVDMDINCAELDDYARRPVPLNNEDIEGRRRSVKRLVRYRMEGFIGKAFLKSHWWKSNGTRVRKLRKNMVSVTKVHES